jgi:HD superfamily phosphodiesterase
MTKIYESPDKGRTVYERESGSTQRTIIKSEGIDDLREHQLWHEIRLAAKTNPTLQKACDRVKMLYRLSIDNPK